MACMLLLETPAASAPERDSIENIRLKEVIVAGGNHPEAVRRASALTVEVTGKEFSREHFTGNLVQALERLPGVHAMHIGSGFAKPVIRGMGFNRVAVMENGVKQEGQQWGADHGLELDAFNVERVIVHKGPASLLHGSDALGGVIEIVHLPRARDGLFGEVVALGRLVNGAVGTSVMLGHKQNAWYAKLRYTEQRFADLRVPADTILYLTRRIPIVNRALKNTAGIERDVSARLEYRAGPYRAVYAASNARQKTGFFPGAHGVPDPARLLDDGHSRDIALPFSLVNHLKITSRQQYAAGPFALHWDLGYQHNHREERSQFHTHYGTQQPPDHDPDLELAFFLDTYSSSLGLKRQTDTPWEYAIGWDIQLQHNRVAGYSFLLPEYNRLATGVFGLVAYRPRDRLSVSGGARYDRGRVRVSPYADAHLETYLREQGYSETEIADYRWRARAVDRLFADVSLSLGVAWQIDDHRLLKANIGRGFRLPGANELAANGVHHGTFRHERGDDTLLPERGWQLDLSYMHRAGPLALSASPFIALLDNYIYLRPTGTWSPLPHAGQEYRYTGARALLAGGELSIDVALPRGFAYRLAGEHVHAHNRDERSPLSFTPPFTARNILSWSAAAIRCNIEWQYLAAQRRVAKNEDSTPSASLLNAGATAEIPLGNARIEIALALENALNARYYNHLSFYRKIEIPEPGRDFRLIIKVPFNNKIN